MERGLALVPKRAGVLHFGPATHKLTIIDEKSQRQERTVTAPPLTLSVGAYPVERGWQWVADDATLTDELSTDPSRLADGQTVTRTVTLRAKGTLARGAAAPPRRLRALADLLRRPGRAPADPHRRRPGLRSRLDLAAPPRDRRARRDPARRNPVLQRHDPPNGRPRDPALPIGYASFFTNQIQTGRFGPAARLASRRRTLRRPRSPAPSSS